MVSYIGKDLGKSGNLKINGYLVFRNYTYSVQTHGAPYCGYGYVPLRLGWGGGGQKLYLFCSDARRPILRPWIHSPEVGGGGGNVVRRMGTQQQFILFKVKERTF